MARIARTGQKSFCCASAAAAADEGARSLVWNVVLFYVSFDNFCPRHAGTGVPGMYSFDNILDITADVLVYI